MIEQIGRDGEKIGRKIGSFFPIAGLPSAFCLGAHGGFTPRAVGQYMAQDICKSHGHQGGLSWS